MTWRLIIGLSTLAAGAVCFSLVGCSDSSSNTGTNCDTCVTANNGICEDGSADPLVATCAAGTDCTDCAPAGTGGGGGVGTGGGGGVGATGGGVTGTCGPFNPALLGTEGFIQDTVTGIFGPWYTFGCQDAVITPLEGDPILRIDTDPANPADDQICFSGTVPQVIDDQYSTYYGAAIGFDLCAMPGDMSTCEDWLPPAYCAWPAESKHTISECNIALNTVSFNITGTIPGDLRLVFKEQDREESPFVTIPASGACVSAAAAQATVAYDPSAPPLDLTRVESLHFQVATNTNGPVAFDFCLSEMNIQ